MRSWTRALVLLLCLVLAAQQAAARAIPVCEHAADSSASEAATPDGGAHDHHAMHGGTDMPVSQSPEPAGACECGCPCALGACLHTSAAAAVLPNFAVSGVRFTSELPSFADAAHPPAAAAVALRPPISA